MRCVSKPKEAGGAGMGVYEGSYVVVESAILYWSCDVLDVGSTGWAKKASEGLRNLVLAESFIFNCAILVERDFMAVQRGVQHIIVVEYPFHCS